MVRTRRGGVRSFCGIALGVLPLVLFAGCGSNHDRVGSPAAPSASDIAATPSSGGSEAALSVAAVHICHSTQGSRSWVPLTIAPAALPAHLAHGDARVGDPVPGTPGVQFGSDCTAAAKPITITFDGLAGVDDRSPVATYTESGFTILPVSGAWVAMTGYGNPAPAIIFMRDSADATMSAAVQVSAGGSAFTFTGVDLYSSVTPIPYTFEGRLNGAVVFTVSGTVPNTFGTFATVANPHAATSVDVVSITLTNPATPCCSNPVGLDNIALAP